MVIDAHSHACPLELIDEMSRTRSNPEVDQLRDQPYVFDWEARIRYMDAHGIDMQVLVPARPPMWLGMESRRVHELARLTNDAMARAVQAHPTRFIGVAVVPIVDDTMLAEVERACTDLGMRGVQIFSNVDGQPIDAEPMWDLFELASRNKLPIWIHPQHGPTHEWMRRDLVDRIFYWPFETSAAMARLVFGGVFDRFPDLKIITHHLGGMIPFYGARIESFGHKMQGYVAAGLTTSNVAASEDVLATFRRFYADTAVTGSRIALRCGIDFFGSDHVLFGTDFPFEGEAVPVEILRSVRELDVSEQTRENLLGGNAARLLGLTPAA